MIIITKSRLSSKSTDNHAVWKTYPFFAIYMFLVPSLSEQSSIRDEINPEINAEYIQL